MSEEYKAGKKLEVPRELHAIELTDKSAILDAIAALGHDLLDEQESRSEENAWLERAQEVIDAHGAAIAIQEDGKTVGFLLADNEGVITQFRCVEGKEPAALEIAFKVLTNKHIEHPKVTIVRKNERMREALRAAGFHEAGSDENDFVTFIKE